MKQFLFGASDDVIELSGAIEDEINSYRAGKKNVHFSDGTLARIGYEDGKWSILVIKQGDLFEKVVEAVGEDEKHTDLDAIAAKAHGRSAVLVLKEGITSVKISGKLYKLPE